ncbi:MAG: apolipoprotein N-acyltransferase [Candidatus Bipolaricaulia bacterium]
MARLERRKALSAVLSGVLAALAMPGFGAGPLVFVALVPLFFALSGKRRFLYGILFGATFMALDFRWILTLYRFSPLVVPGLVLLVLYLSLFFGVASLVIRQSRTRPFQLLLVAPVAITLLEVVRAQGPLGTGFSSLYHALYRTPSLIQIASVLGPWAITALIVLVNAAVFLAIRQRRLTYLIAAGAAVGLLAAFSLVPVAPARADPIRVAVVSSNVKQEEKLDGRNLRDLTERYIDLGRLAVAGNPDLVVFPESILPAFILDDDELLERLSALAATGKTRVLFGTGVYRDREIYNTVALLSSSGDLLGTYEMVRPVPFGEYVPGRRIWEAIGLGRLVDSFLPVDLTPGEAFAPLDGIGTPICFESTFPDPARRLVENGAQILAIVTNDAWFVGSSELEAHFAAAVFRAVETRRFVVQAANSGVSGLVDPKGRILAATKREEVLHGTVYARTDRALYARWGDLPLLLLLGAGGLAFIAIRVRREKRNGE